MELGGLAHDQEEIRIKADPDSPATIPRLSWEEDVYEDAGDLDFEHMVQKTFLMRLPKFLWKIWSQVEDDEEIHLGKVRIESQQGDIRRVSTFCSNLITTY